jgi:UDP-N-acetylmuramate dehydrogenase
MPDLATELTSILGAGHVRTHHPLAPYTTFKAGGPADWFVEPRGEAELVAVLRAAGAAGVPVTLLGGGSNVLVGDAGIRGLVVRPRGGTIEEERPGRVRAGAAVTVNALVRWTIGRGLQGLEAWAGTPGTVGGAVAGNAHFGGRGIGVVVESARLLDRAARLIEARRADMEFGYGRSRLQRTREILLSAAFRLVPGADPGALRAVARASLAHRKRTQPLHRPSAGCIFQNPDPARDRVPAGIPVSAGALVDRAGLKGRAIGGARVSPVHANFIVNEGHATAADIRALIELCRARVVERFGVHLREEVVYLGEF